MNSGRWKELDVASWPCDRAEVEARAVSEVEALSGIGTYVAAVCTSLEYRQGSSTSETTVGLWAIPGENQPG
ncbi:hypothetical protein PC116_g1252 [Phytophthora cactorum]|nr:hypothetical protein PC120_g26029 [Phytophthora cactorum]KAG3037281.1 hypothetical protein PC119_g3780 [Phytophthora cactorum]KAG3091452.1 hypothetical protein PC121_g3836 [Phytophthora cactorum]KAG3179586.1 hypothetical protein C6341_g7441 [Phytophthora cactorum]KAG3186149.1 hypothetical protein PC128_g13064 [Phytophthora cactorum]